MIQGVEARVDRRGRESRGPIVRGLWGARPVPLQLLGSDRPAWLPDRAAASGPTGPLLPRRGGGRLHRAEGAAGPDDRVSGLGRSVHGGAGDPGAGGAEGGAEGGAGPTVLREAGTPGGDRLRADQPGEQSDVHLVRTPADATERDTTYRRIETGRKRFLQ